MAEQTQQRKENKEKGFLAGVGESVKKKLNSNNKTQGTYSNGTKEISKVFKSLDKAEVAY